MGLKIVVCVAALLFAVAAAAPLAAENLRTKNLAYLSPYSAAPLHIDEPAHVPEHSWVRDSGISAESASRKLLQTTRPIRAAFFKHGVASGDPFSDSVVLWTKVTPAKNETTTLTVNWVLYQRLDTPLASGSAVTDASVDWTVKVIADGLLPGSIYFYYFYVSYTNSDTIFTRSPYGRTRTLPTSTKYVKYAVVSCSNFPYGYFNAYREIAKLTNLDAVLHVGDYIYEYGNGTYSNPKLPADRTTTAPLNEIVTLSDYRARHAQYKTDVDLQAAHRQHPWITVWDDHESANNAWMDGAENHNSTTEGLWTTRLASAIRAYYEYLPLRQVDTSNARRIYRKFSFGSLVDLVMLDTRIIGRAQQIDDPYFIKTNITYTNEFLNDPNRQIMGADQESWLFSSLNSSQAQGTRWRAIGNQVQLLDSRFTGISAYGLPPFPPNYDAWAGGYPAARRRLLNYIGANGIDNVIAMTGDIHTSWVADIIKDPFIKTTVSTYPNFPVAINPASGYNSTTGAGSYAVEFVGTSVSSPGIDSFFGDSAAALNPAICANMVANSPGLKYVDLIKKGFLIMEFTDKYTWGRNCYVNTTLSRTYSSSCDNGFYVLPQVALAKPANVTCNRKWYPRCAPCPTCG